MVRIGRVQFKKSYFWGYNETLELDDLINIADQRGMLVEPVTYVYGEGIVTIPLYNDTSFSGMEDVITWMYRHENEVLEAINNALEYLQDDAEFFRFPLLDVTSKLKVELPINLSLEKMIEDADTIAINLENNNKDAYVVIDNIPYYVSIVALNPYEVNIA